MKLAASALILVTILNGVGLLSIHSELAADGVILGGALAAHHVGEVFAPFVNRVHRWPLARLRRARRRAR